MATLMAGIKGKDGKFYQKSIAWDKRGRPVDFIAGQKIETSDSNFEVSEVTRYFVVSREGGKRVQTGPAFEKLTEAQIEMSRVKGIEKSRKLTNFSRHVVEQPPVELAVTSAVAGTWDALVTEYLEKCRREMLKGNLKASSIKAYTHTIGYFSEYLAACQISNLSDITTKTIEAFKVSRIEGKQKGQTKDGAKQAHVVISKRLNPVFEMAVNEQLIARNPVQYDSAKGSADRGAMPYSTAERKKLEAKAAESPAMNLIYWFLLQSGMRRSDAVSLKWKDVNGHIAFTAIKNGKAVRLPIQARLKSILDAERNAAEGSAREAMGLGEATENEYVLLHPETHQAFHVDTFYREVVELGERARVKAHPHRFRDSFAADCFLKGCDVSEIAFYLGDAVRTVETHYAAFINERKDRADAKLLG